jgi:hypothetical protein
MFRVVPLGAVEPGGLRVKRNRVKVEDSLLLAETAGLRAKVTIDVFAPETDTALKPLDRHDRLAIWLIGIIAVDRQSGNSTTKAKKSSLEKPDGGPTRSCV